MNLLTTTAVTAATLLLWPVTAWSLIIAVGLLYSSARRAYMGTSRRAPRRHCPTYPATHGGLRPQ